MSDSTEITSVNFTQFGRIGKVELLLEGKRIENIYTDGLDFKFNTTQMYWASPNVVPASATVSILGLSQRSVDYLCQFTDQNAYQLRGISARISVGYETGVINGLQEVFCLPVVRAMASALPENWTTLTCCLFSGPRKEMDYQMENSVSNAKDGKRMSAYECIVKVGKDVGIEWVWSGKTQEMSKAVKLYGEFSFKGSVEAAVNKLREKFGKYLSFVAETSGDPNVYRCMIYPAMWNKNSDLIAQNTWTVNKTTGLIGVPNWLNGTSGGGESFKRVKVRTLLNPSLRPYDKVILKSDVLSGLNGDYKIINVSHTGHLRGNEWYSDIEMYNGGLGNQKK